MHDGRAEDHPSLEGGSMTVTLEGVCLALITIVLFWAKLKGWG
jgi:hypothetical protein